MLIFIVSFASGTGCARKAATITDARGLYAGGDLAAAASSLQSVVDGRGRYGDSAALDLAMVKLASGQPQAAEADFRRLRDRFDAIPKLSLAHEFASVMTDDSARIYEPAGHELVMIRAMLSLCSLASDQMDAEAYALQATVKQDDLRQQAEGRGLAIASEDFQAIAFAPYLRGMLREATHRNYDDAAKAYQLVSSVRPDFAPVGEDIQRASTGVHSQPGHGVLYVFACVGEGPVLVESEASTTTTALSIASSALNAETNKKQDVAGPAGDAGDDQDDGSLVVLPNIASVKVPTVSIPGSQISAVGIRVDGNLFGATQTLTDVGELAINQSEAELPWTIARAVIRRATKEATVAAVGDSLGLEGNAGSIFHFAASTAWSSTEGADTRCWGLLPREIQVLRAELPAGVYDMSAEPLGFAGELIGQPSGKSIRITSGRNTYAIAIVPRERVYWVTKAQHRDVVDYSSSFHRLIK